jgi:hypothetical protein
MCRQVTPPKQRGERTQAKSNHRTNGSRHSAGSCGGMLADGAFISRTGRVGTKPTKWGRTGVLSVLSVDALGFSELFQVDSSLSSVYSPA